MTIRKVLRVEGLGSEADFALTPAFGRHDRRIQA
jgi:hypothetical protein